SSVRRKRNSPSCNLSEGTPPATATNRRSIITRLAETTPAPAEAAKSTKSAMVKLLSLFSLLLFLSSAQAGIWPAQFGPAKLVSAKTVHISNQGLWSEY